MPFVFKFSLLILVASFGVGQSWLHGSASQGDVASARAAMAACPAAGRMPRIRTQWDVIRANDVVRIASLKSALGLADGC